MIISCLMVACVSFSRKLCNTPLGKPTLHLTEQNRCAWFFTLSAQILMTWYLPTIDKIRRQIHVILLLLLLSQEFVCAVKSYIFVNIQFCVFLEKDVFDGKFDLWFHYSIILFSTLHGKLTIVAFKFVIQLYLAIKEINAQLIILVAQYLVCRPDLSRVL